MANKVMGKKGRVVFLASLGGGLEFYDFVVFAIFASVIGDLFFPSASSQAKLLSTFSVFAMGYLIRPLGGILFSHLGDKIGRKKTFMFSISLMAVATLLMSITPTYHAIGISATFIFVFLRLLQGVSLGGEIPGAITFITEHYDKAPGAACGILFFCLNIGLMLASLMYLLLAYTLTNVQMALFGWRIAFALGGLLAVVSFYLRRDIEETEAFKKLTKKQAFPLAVVLIQYRYAVAVGIAVSTLAAMIVTIGHLFMISYLQTILHYSTTFTSYITFFHLFIFSLASPFFAYLSDRIGRRKMLIFCSVLIFLWTPLFYSLLIIHVSIFWPFFFINAVVFAICTGSAPCYLSELFQTEVRYTGIALCYNIGFGIFGGIGPLLSSYFIQRFDLLLAPAYLLMFAAMSVFMLLIRFTYSSRLLRDPMPSATT